MMYEYSTERAKLFTEEGQVMFLKIRDNVQRLLKEAGAVRAQEALGNVCGDGWTMLACLDRLVELREIRRVERAHHVNAQDEIYVRAG